MEQNVPSQVLWNILFYNLIMVQVLFAERMKNLREEKGVTREELANALNVSIRLISYWENGKRECNFEMLMLIAEYFDCSIDYLLGRTDY